MTDIHPTVIIHPSVKIAEGVKIGPYTVIGEEVEIGEDSEIGPMVVLHKWVKIGKNCKIAHGASIGGEPQDLKYKGTKSFCHLGDNVIVREFVTIHRGTPEGSITQIGNHCFLMAYSHIAHQCKIGKNVILANSVNLAGHVEIEDFAVVGGLTPVHQFVQIGCYAIVGGASRCAKDVLPYAKAAGNPMKIYGLNNIALERYGFKPETRILLSKAFRLIFRSSLNTSQALEQLKSDFPQTPEVTHLIEFIEKSKRGIEKHSP
ncbi:MAG: acyl-ACP--UDP-N-acetylglucosamine O-acyltransferase [Candidatus Edwardsbacteria bacterium]